MSRKDSAIIAQHEPYRANLSTYISGFVLSVVLTMVAYLGVVDHAFKSNALIAFIIGLALIQFLVQLFFFLHLGRETKPRWKLMVLGFMVTVVLILVIGSLWIMYNLNYRMMPKTRSQVNTYLNQQNGGI